GATRRNEKQRLEAREGAPPASGRTVVAALAFVDSCPGAWRACPVSRWDGRSVFHGTWAGAGLSGCGGRCLVAARTVFLAALGQLARRYRHRCRRGECGLSGAE